MDDEVLTDGGGRLDVPLFDMMSGVRWKVAFLLFIFLLFVNTSIFTERIASKFSDAVSIGQLTEKGIVVQSTVVIIAFIILDLLSSGGYI